MYVQFNDGTINKGRDIKELARTIKTFEYGNTRGGVKCYNHWEKKTICQQII